MSTQVKPKSYRYEVGVRWSSEKRGNLTASGKPDLPIASPPEFRGHPGIWTPEDLLVAAVNACAMLTFLSAVARKEIRLVSYDCGATGTLEMADGVFRFTNVVLRPHIILKPGEDAARALAAFREAETTCLVANSLVTRIESQPEVSVRD